MHKHGPDPEERPAPWARAFSSAINTGSWYPEPPPASTAHSPGRASFCWICRKLEPWITGSRGTDPPGHLGSLPGSTLTPWAVLDKSWTQFLYLGSGGGTYWLALNFTEQLVINRLMFVGGFELSGWKTPWSPDSIGNSAQPTRYPETRKGPLIVYEGFPSEEWGRGRELTVAGKETFWLLHGASSLDVFSDP